ncbi:NaeI family type II restriction endonuclease [Streptomyces sp. NPDC015661]|uniref:NaeI family type II restriction endonuclease n=1 Tax=Streptomyces sp. NPDC015661 TaxID=3364961 RepID=UPI0036FE60E8
MRQRSPERGGRPPAAPRGSSDAENELVLFLRRLRVDAGLTVEQVHLRLPDVIGGIGKPAPSTLHKRLGGTNLRNSGSLVEAVIQVCVADPDEAEAARETAKSLVKTAWPQPAPGGTAPGRGEGADDCAAHLLKLVKVQERLLETAAELATVLRAKEEAESALAAWRGAGHAELADLRRTLGDVTAERDAARRAAEAAQRRIAVLEGRLAAGGAPPHAAPTGGAARPAPDSARPTAAGDGEVEAVRRELLRLDPRGRRMTAVLAETLERLLDGEHTGRYHWDSLGKAEKTMTGQLVENLFLHDFRFERGRRLDFVIAGTEVDMKVSTGTNWMIPPEAVGGLCLLVGLDHRRNRWSLGLIGVSEDLLARGSNKDGKRSISVEGRRAITWIQRDVPLPVSALALLPGEDATAILADPSGQQRVNELFRRVQHRLLRRTDVVTVARQADAPKRVREARRALAAEGVLVLGHQSVHAEPARDLGLPVPEQGTWVSARLVPAEEGSRARTILLGGTRWRLAHAGDAPHPLPET